MDTDSDESGKEDGYEVGKNQPSSREFEEKVAEEKEVECSKFESSFADGDWDNVPTFEQWAVRMS